MNFWQLVLNKILVPFSIKFWYLTLSTMEILTPKVGTVPKKIREVFMVNKSLCALFSVSKNRVVSANALKQKQFYLKPVGAEKSLQKLCCENRTFHICIKHFRTKLQMAQQTNFFKLSRLKY